MPSCLVSSSLEDLQGQGSHCTVGRRTVRKTKVETFRHPQGKMLCLPKGRASSAPEYLMDQLLPRAAPSISLRSRNSVRRLQGHEVRTPKPTVPQGLSTGPATPRRLTPLRPGAPTLSCEGKSGGRQPEPAGPRPTASLPGACLQLTRAIRQRSQLLTLPAPCCPFLANQPGALGFLFS